MSFIWRAVLRLSQGEISALVNLARTLGGFSVAYFQVPWATKHGAVQTFGVESAIVAGLFLMVVPALQLRGRSLRVSHLHHPSLITPTQHCHRPDSPSKYYTPDCVLSWRGCVPCPPMRMFAIDVTCTSGHDLMSFSGPRCNDTDYEP